MPINYDMLQGIKPSQLLGKATAEAPKAPMMSSQASQDSGDDLSSLLGGLGKLFGGNKPQGAGIVGEGANSAPMSPQMGLMGVAKQGLGMNPNVPNSSTPQDRAINSNLKGYDLANSMVGMNEVRDHDALKGFLAKSGQNVDPASTPWCAYYANSVLQASGYKGTGSGAARSFLNYGTPTKTPTQGDIVVLSRDGDPSKGHVGFYSGLDKQGNVLVLGGNQGDSVSIKAFSPNRVLGYRQPLSGQQVQQGIAPKNSHPELLNTMQGISHVESSGEKDPYNAVGKATAKGQKAYGKYQVMDFNIPQWTREATGMPMTPQQFLANPQAQEKVAAFKINQYLQQGYTPQDAASLWFTGQPLGKAKPGVKDAYGTTNEQYQTKFNQGYLQSKGPMQSAYNSIHPGQVVTKPTPGIQPPQIPKELLEQIIRQIDKGKSYEG